MIRDNWKQQLIVNVLKDEIGKCREEIASYNNQFLASSAMCAVLAALVQITLEWSACSGGLETVSPDI